MPRPHLPIATFRVLLGALAALCAGGSAAGEIMGDDHFGEAIALSGDTVVVGRPSTGTGSNTREGAALVFVRRLGAWQYQAKLEGGFSSIADGFGTAVALQGDTVVIAAPAANPPAVHVFEREGNRWSRRARIDAPQSNIGFARAVALDGDTLMVGAAFRNASRGAVYVFQRASKDWQLAQVLVADDGTPDARFGTALALDGSRAVVGAFGEDFGAAYVFDRIDGTWEQSQRLDALDAQLGDRFGLAVALEGERIVVGAPGTESDDHEQQGAAIVFERSLGSWSQTAELSAFDGRQNDLFGWSLSLDGNTLVAGAIFDTDTVINQGSAYAFTQVAGTWVSSMKLRASQVRTADVFGSAVALEGDVLWVGAPGFQTTSPGAAYAFERAGLVWNVGERFVDPTLFDDQFEAD